MMARERTRQQLDPIGTFGGSLTAIVFAVVAFVLAAVVVISQIDAISQPSLAVVALVFLGLGCVRLMIASNPIRAPFTARSMAVVVFTGVAASVFESASVWGEPLLSRSEWGPLALGLLFLAMGPYRPARELAAAGTLAVVFLGFIAVLRNGMLEPNLPALAVVAVSVLPVLTLAYASAAYSSTVVDALERWHAKMQNPGRVVSRDDENSIARSVQQERVTILNREVLPFFLEMIDAETITDADRSRARSIAESFREVMVAEVDRSWLEQLVEEVSHQPLDIAKHTIRDDDHIADVMSYDQRTALRAFLLVLYRAQEKGVGMVTIDLYREEENNRFILAADFELSDFTLRTQFSPYFAVLRAVFPDLRIEHTDGTLTLSFSYEQR